MTASRTASDNNRRIHTTLHLRVRACADYRRVTRVRYAEPAGIAATETQRLGAPPFGGAAKRRMQARYGTPARTNRALGPRLGPAAERIGVHSAGSALAVPRLVISQRAKAFSA